MDFRLRSTGELITRQQLAARLPNTSLGLNLSPEEYDEYGIDDVVLAEPPACDQRTETVAYTVEQIDGVWTQVWKVVALPAGQAAANMQAYQDGVTAEMARYLNDEVRAPREKLLNRLAGIGFAADKRGDQATVDAYLVARDRLLGLTTTPAAQAAKAAFDLAALKSAVKQEYVEIVTSVPASLINAFDMVDQ